MNKPYVVAVGARSAGHILPARAYARQIAQPFQGSVHVITSTAALDKRVVSEGPGVSVSRYALDPVPSRIGARAVWLVWLMGYLLRTLGMFIRHRPSAVVTTGGYLTLPVWYAAWILRIPRYAYELNVVPGAALRHVAPTATAVRCCFKETHSLLPAGCCREEVCYPLTHTPTTAGGRHGARQTLGIPHHLYTLVVLGGSQGSQQLNSTVLEALRASTTCSGNAHVLHQAGPGNAEEVRKLYVAQGISSLVVEYTADIGLWLASADLVVARGGAGTLAEIAAFECRALILPLRTSHTAHQVDNAGAYARRHPHLIQVMSDPEALYKALNQDLSKSCPPCTQTSYSPHQHP